MTSRGSDSLTWDGWGRNSGGTYSGTTISYSYDPAGNLASRTSATTTRYLYGGTSSPVFETDGSGTITLAYVQGPDGELAHYAGPPDSSSSVSYLYFDGHGNLAATADGSGSRTADYTYDPFGTPNDTVPTDTTTQRWTGAYDKQLDTTSNLILMGARPYDPQLGRFTTTDPIDGGSLNPYDYTGQDPINNYDLSGELPVPPPCGFGRSCHYSGGGINWAHVATVALPLAANFGVRGLGLLCGPAAAGCEAAITPLAAAASAGTSYVTEKYIAHQTTGTALTTAGADALISAADLGIGGVLDRLEARGAANVAGSASARSAARALRIKPHTAAWARYHHR